MAAMKDVHDHPKRFFVLGEGLFYSSGKVFAELLRPASLWSGFSPSKQVAMLPPSGVSHELFSNFLRQSAIFQRVCDLRDDVEVPLDGRKLGAKENGHCHYASTLSPVTVVETRDLWWQESRWVFGLATGLVGVEGYSNVWIYNSLIDREAHRPGSRIARFIKSRDNRRTKRENQSSVVVDWPTAKNHRTSLLNHRGHFSVVRTQTDKVGCCYETPVACIESSSRCG